jgi:hypothetical protein
MVELIAAVALAPWAEPLRFRPSVGWETGSSGTVHSSYGPVPHIGAPKASIAWTVRGVHYRDRSTADPPNRTLSRIPRDGVIVFAVIYQSGRDGGKEIGLRLSRARHYACCDGTYVAGGEYELDGLGPSSAYSVIVRVYFGSPPTRLMRAEAQNALDRLELPPLR